MKQHDFYFHRSKSLAMHILGPRPWYINRTVHIAIQESIEIEFIRLRIIIRIVMQSVTRYPDAGAEFYHNRFTGIVWWQFEFFDAYSIQESQYRIQSTSLIHYSIQIFHTIDDFISKPLVFHFRSLRLSWILAPISCIRKHVGDDTISKSIVEEDLGDYFVNIKCRFTIFVSSLLHQLNHVIMDEKFPAHLWLSPGCWRCFWRIFPPLD